MNNKKHYSDLPQLRTRTLQSAEKPASIFIYKFGRFLIRTLGFWYFKVKVNGKQNLNLKGGIIIAPVHRSNLDGPLINSLAQRRIKSLSKVSMFKTRFTAWLFSSLGCVPLDRKANDRDALKVSQELLEGQAPMLIFPEGLRGSGPVITNIFEGCSFLSIHTGCPVVIVGIAGTEAALPTNAKWPKRVKVNIEVGEPLYPPVEKARSFRKEFSNQIHKELQRLFDLSIQAQQKR